MKHTILTLIGIIALLLPSCLLYSFNDMETSEQTKFDSNSMSTDLPFDMSRSSYGATGSITGYVVDLITGDPIEGAKVSILSDIHPKLKFKNPPVAKKKPFDFTDADGLYLIENISVGKYVANVKAENYLEAFTDAEILESEATQLDFELNPCENGATGDLHGFVHDAITGEPIAGSKVSFKIPFKCISDNGNIDDGDVGDIDDGKYGDSNGIFGGDRSSYEGDSSNDNNSDFEVNRVFIAETDEYGEYLIKDIPIGEFIVSAKAKDYEPATGTALIAFGETTELNFELIPCDSEYSGSLSGIVKDEETGEPISDALIFIKVKDFTPGCGSLMMHKVSSAEDGSYSFDKLPSGTHSITAWAKGYLKFTGEVTIEAGINLDLDILLRSMLKSTTGTLKGIVIDSKGDLVEGASIKLVFKKVMGAKAFQRLLTMTDQDGYFIIEEVPVGELTVTAKKGNQGNGSVTTEIFKDEITEVEIFISKKKSDN